MQSGRAQTVSASPKAAKDLRASRISVSSKWCRNCDKNHESGGEASCPLRSPKVVITDSVIDFSTKSENTDNTRGSGEGGRKSSAERYIKFALF